MGGREHGRVGEGEGRQARCEHLANMCRSALISDVSCVSFSGMHGSVQEQSRSNRSDTVT